MILMSRILVSQKQVRHWHIHSEQTAMEGYVIQSHRRKQDQYLFDFASGCRDHGDRNDRRDHLWMERKETGYDSDADIRHFPCISRSGFCPGSCSRDGRRRTECGYSPWAISWPKYARIARSQTLAQKESLYMRAAILSGCSTGKLILKHILPNITGPILVTAMLDIGTMMMELAGLSFLGLGAKPPVAEWGSMMSDTRNLLTTHPWVTFAPGIAIFLSSWFSTCLAIR